MDKKEHILNESLNLFNEKGFTALSLRQIAAALNMSDGNLRYHFKTKEDLLMAQFQSMLDAMYALGEKVSPPETTNFEKIFVDTLNTYKLIYNYRFIFLETTPLLTSYNSFMMAYYNMVENRKTWNMDRINKLIANGIITPMDERSIEQFYVQIFLLSESWVKFVHIKNLEGKDLEKAIAYYAEVTAKLIKPYLINQ